MVMIPQYKGISILIHIAKLLPVLFHAAYIIFIVIALISDPSNVAAYIYSLLLAIAHIWWLLVHCFVVIDFSFEDLGMTKLLLAFHCIVNVGFSIIGSFCFGGYTGYTVVGYAYCIGFGEWQNLPLMFQLMYFNIWLDIVGIIACIVGILLTIAYVCCLWEYLDFIQEWCKPNPPPLVAISTVSPLE